MVVFLLYLIGDSLSTFIVLDHLVETAKANNLKIYEYLKYLLEKIPEHMEDTNLEFTDDLLPWSESLPDCCRR